jgi:plastocyanin
VLVAALSTGNKIGLAVVAAVFITFALTSSFVASRRRPDFPGPNGLSVFVIASIALFAAMITAVVVLGVESEAKGAAESPAATAPSAEHTIAVSETEFKIAVPSTTLTPGKYTFVVKNAGKLAHDLVFEGPNVSGHEGTPLIQPAGTAKVTVSLTKGDYTLYCSVDGHRAAGMVTKITVS